MHPLTKWLAKSDSDDRLILIAELAAVVGVALIVTMLYAG
jgi:hypothetical protein